MVSPLHACELSQRVHHRFSGMQDKALKRGGMSDVRHLEGEMQDENRKARP